MQVRMNKVLNWKPQDLQNFRLEQLLDFQELQLETVSRFARIAARNSLKNCGWKQPQDLQELWLETASRFARFPAGNCFKIPRIFDQKQPQQLRDFQPETASRFV